MINIHIKQNLRYSLESPHFWLEEREKEGRNAQLRSEAAADRTERFFEAAAATETKKEEALSMASGKC